MVDDKLQNCERAQAQPMTNPETMRCTGAAAAVREERPQAETLKDTIRQWGETETYLMEQLEATDEAVDAVAEAIQQGKALTVCNGSYLESNKVATFESRVETGDRQHQIKIAQFVSGEKGKLGIQSRDVRHHSNPGNHRRDMQIQKRKTRENCGWMQQKGSTGEDLHRMGRETHGQTARLASAGPRSTKANTNQYQNGTNLGKRPR